MIRWTWSSRGKPNRHRSESHRQSQRLRRWLGPRLNLPPCERRCRWRRCRGLHLRAAAQLEARPAASQLVRRGQEVDSARAARAAKPVVNLRRRDARKRQHHHAQPVQLRHRREDESTTLWTSMIQVTLMTCWTGSTLFSPCRCKHGRRRPRSVRQSCRDKRLCPYNAASLEAKPPARKAARLVGGSARAARGAEAQLLSSLHPSHRPGHGHRHHRVLQETSKNPTVRTMSMRTRAFMKPELTVPL